MFGALLMLIFVTSCGAQAPPDFVPNGQIVGVVNPNYDAAAMDVTQQYSQYKYAGDSIAQWKADDADETKNFTIEVMAAANIPAGRIGIFVKKYNADGSTDYEILGPGLYRTIPQKFVDMGPDGQGHVAANVPGGYMGLYCNYDEAHQEFRLLKPGVYALPMDMTRLYPTGTQRYRTLDRAVLESNPNPGDPACQSAACETSITNAILSGTGVKMAYDVDVEFQYDLTQANAKALCDFGSPAQMIQSVIATDLRNQGRAITGRFTEEEIITEAGRNSLADALLEMLRAEAAGAPVNFLTVSVRSITVGDAAYQTAKQEAAQALADAVNQGVILEQLKENAIKENELRALQAKGWSQALEALGCTGDWRCLWVLMHGTENVPYYNGTDLQEPPQP